MNLKNNKLVVQCNSIDTAKKIRTISGMNMNDEVIVLGFKRYNKEGYALSINRGQYCGIDYYNKEGYTIISANEYLKMKGETIKDIKIPERLLTTNDLKAGYRVETISERDSMPIGKTGIVIQVGRDHNSQDIAVRMDDKNILHLHRCMDRNNYLTPGQDGYWLFPKNLKLINNKTKGEETMNYKETVSISETIFEHAYTKEEARLVQKHCGDLIRNDFNGKLALNDHGDEYLIEAKRLQAEENKRNESNS